MAGRPAGLERMGRSTRWPARKFAGGADAAYDPIGTARQAVATVAYGDRTECLRRLRVPTLVIQPCTHQRWRL
jgi:hypothetical protein